MTTNDIEKYRPALRRFLGRRMVPRQEIDDLVQEVFVRVYAAQARKRLVSPKSFLFTIAKNLLIDRQRRNEVRGTEVVVDAELVGCRSAGPEELASISARMALLRRAVCCLPPRCRAAFLLRQVHHLSYRAIAERMGVTEKTVEKHLARAVLLCRQFILEAEADRPAIVDLEQYRRRRGEPGHLPPKVIEK